MESLYESCSPLSTPPENIRKPEDFNVFKGYRKRPAFLSEKRLRHKCFLGNFAKFIRSLFDDSETTASECILKKIRNYRNSRQRCSIIKGVLRNSQNSQESTYARESFLIKMLTRPTSLLKKSLWHRCFPYYRTPLVAASGRIHEEHEDVNISRENLSCS